MTPNFKRIESLAATPVHIWGVTKLKRNNRTLHRLINIRDIMLYPKYTTYTVLCQSLGTAPFEIEISAQDFWCE